MTVVQKTRALPFHQGKGAEPVTSSQYRHRTKRTTHPWVTEFMSNQFLS